MSLKASLVVKDHGWEALIKRAKEISDAKGMKVKVGVLDDAEGGAKHPNSIYTVAEIAAVHEFGTEDGTIPARSFVRTTFDEQREKLIEMGQELFVKVIFGEMNATTALGLMGSFTSSAIRDKIRSNIPPPNAPETLLRKASKGKTKRFFGSAARTLGGALAQVGALAAVVTLIDTATMLRAVTWALIRSGEED